MIDCAERAFPIDDPLVLETFVASGYWVPLRPVGENTPIFLSPSGVTVSNVGCRRTISGRVTDFIQDDLGRTICTRIAFDSFRRIVIASAGIATGDGKGSDRLQKLGWQLIEKAPAPRTVDLMRVLYRIHLTGTQ